MNTISRRLLLLALPWMIVGCDDDDGVRPRPVLSPEEVSGIYEVCSLAFVPEQQAFPRVDLLRAAFETEDPAVRDPRLALDPNRTFELEFTPKGNARDQEITGTFKPQERSVVLSFGSAAPVPSSLLLPTTLALEFGASPQTLSTSASHLFHVPRADYARLAGISESGLAQTIPGRLVSRFAVGTCPS